MWRSDVLSPRFLLGRINLQNARDKFYASKDHYVVFIGEESLGAYLLEQPHNKPDEALLPEHLSPYLKCMLAVARQLDISPENQPKKASLEATLKETWLRMRGAEPASTDLDRMATLLREPESKAGRGAKPA